MSILPMRPLNNDSILFHPIPFWEVHFLRHPSVRLTVKLITPAGFGDGQALDVSKCILIRTNVMSMMENNGNIISFWTVWYCKSIFPFTTMIFLHIIHIYTSEVPSYSITETYHKTPAPAAVEGGVPQAASVEPSTVSFAAYSSHPWSMNVMSKWQWQNSKEKRDSDRKSQMKYWKRIFTHVSCHMTFGSFVCLSSPLKGWWPNFPFINSKFPDNRLALRNLITRNWSKCMKYSSISQQASNIMKRFLQYLVLFIKWSIKVEGTVMAFCWWKDANGGFVPRKRTYRRTTAVTLSHKKARM